MIILSLVCGTSLGSINGLIESLTVLHLITCMCIYVFHGASIILPNMQPKSGLPIDEMEA